MSARGQWRHSPLGHRPLPRAARVPAPCSSGLSGLRVSVLVRCLPSASGLRLPCAPRPAESGAAQLVGGACGEESRAEEARQGAPHPNKDFNVPGRCCVSRR